MWCEYSLISASKHSRETHGEEAFDSNKQILLLVLTRSSFKETQDRQGIETLDLNKSISDFMQARQEFNSSFFLSMLLTSFANSRFSKSKASQDLQGKDALKCNILISDFR
jgi:hypothetical protein